MKRTILLLLIAALLCGCTATAGNTAVPVSILEGEGFTVENNGLWVEPGQDAVFLLSVEPGCTVGSVDYAGEFCTAVRDGKLELTLKAVAYPTRIGLELTQDYGLITYEPNGGRGEGTTLIYDLSVHLRPNTATALFEREGHTLTGWNTEPDGSGQRIGLGSRVTTDREGVTLYAQWEEWNPESDFTCSVGYGVTITGFHGSGDTVVIPETIGGKTVTGIAYGAFRDCTGKRLILPKTIRQVAQGAFQRCAFESVVLYDTIESISNSSFQDCSGPLTVYINAAEAPSGYASRKESCYADKLDLLIRAAGERKLVCYGGCAMWYNLDGVLLDAALGQDYRVINLGLNGMTNSALQMQIMLALMEEGDILFHAPELASDTQMMRRTYMNQSDDLLWCGLEYNYDLVSLVDVQSVPNLLDSLCGYLERKDKQTDYAACYLDSQGRSYWDEWGCIPFARTQTMEILSDPVSLDPDSVDKEAMAALKGYYDRFRELGVTVYVGYACVNLDALAEEERENAAVMDARFREALDGVTVISSLEDYLYTNKDFYDTNYHLLTEAAAENTALWLRDLLAQMERDGLREVGQ